MKSKTLLFVLRKLAYGSYKDWSGEWVHYTDINKLGINPKQFHMDLSGIYLFPKEFKTSGTIWKSKKYKYIVKLKENAKVLDLSTLSEDDLWAILDKLNIDKNSVYTAEKALDVDNFWESLKNYYTISNKSRSAGAALWNKEFRRLGYDAIFDDTGSIHTSEVQIVVLDPKVLTVVDVETQNVKRGQFDRIKVCLDLLAKKLKPYGKVEVEPLKKRKEWSEKKLSLKGRLKLVLDGGKYIDWIVEEDEANYAMRVIATRTNIQHMLDNWNHYSDSVWVEYNDKSENKIEELVSRVMKKATAK